MPREDFIWALGTLCGLHRIAFDADLILKQFPPPYDLAALRRAAAACGLKAGLADADARQIGALPLPCLGFVRKGAGAAPACALALLVKADSERLLYFLPRENTPRTMPLAQFAASFEPRVLLARREIPAAEDADRDAARSFGFAWFLPELARHRGIWKEVLAASLFIQVVALATPLFTQVVIDKVVVHQTQSTLAAIAAGMLACILFSAVMTWARQYLVAHTGNRVDAVLGARVWQHLMRLPERYFLHRPTGTLVARVHGVETIREFVTGAAVTLLLDLPFLFVFLAVMSWYSWQLTLVALGILLLLVVLSVAVTPLLRRRIDAQFLLGARNQAFMTEYIAGHETVKALQFEPQLERRYGENLAAYLNASFATRQLSSTCNVLASALEQVQTLAILVAGALLVMKNDGFTVGMLVAFQMFAARMSQPMLRLAGLWQEFQQAAIAVKRLGDVMDVAAEPYSAIPARHGKGEGRIEIENLAFRYGADRPWLFRDFALRIEPGTCVALTGRSGTGKSTLTRLLLGFYLPLEGSIRIDGRDSRALSANELRGHFGVVPQETMLFSGTVYENLSLANPHADFGEIVGACRMAEIHDTIERLPNGYQTAIGEHGAGLSGGQKQRIAIARAILKRPQVLIFDEATSNLDAPTAEQFAGTINQLKGKVTVLFIAHRIPENLQVDETVTLGDGHAQQDRAGISLDTIGGGGA